jgi:predicted AAA+ superfamily ATPase
VKGGKDTSPRAIPAPRLVDARASAGYNSTSQWVIFHHQVVIFQMIPRHLRSAVLEALQDTPVVLLHGARRTGKSTLAQSLAAEAYPARYVTLDDLGALSAASTDPAGFLAGLPDRVVLDEVQRVPELFLAIKQVVDRSRQAGRFLLTGSANVMSVPQLSESLAGRMEILTLWPFSQGEIERVRERFVDAAFSEGLPPLAGDLDDRQQILRRVVMGGYPEPLQRGSARRRRAWFSSYVASVVQRDIRELSNIDQLTAMPRLLGLLAARATGLLNLAELSRTSGIARTTLERYMALLQAIFLVQTVPAWSAHLGKRLVKSPKVVLHDTGLLSHLLGVTEASLDDAVALHGRLLENFVAMELRKQIAWSQTCPAIYHFRSHSGQEVDLLLEDPAGRVVGVEVKASSTVRAEDFAGLRAVSQLLPDRFHRGILLYTGRETVPFGPRLHALPVNALWRLGA